MKCPRCGKDMSKSNSHVFCTHCGYLDNGNQIHGYTEYQASDLEIYLGDEYHKIYRNENFLTSLILGPLYLCYRGFLLLGLLFIPIELFIWDIIGHSFSTFSMVLTPLAILLTRCFFMAVNNMICIYFYQKKIDRIKKKYPDNYLTILRNQRKQVPLPIVVLCFILAVSICILVGWFFLSNVWY